MNGKSIVVIGALAAGAYLLLRSGVGGGAEGGGTKKATAITGVVPGFDGGGSPGFGGVPSYPETPSAPSAPFQPSPYLLGLIAQKYNTPTPAEKMGLTPMSKKESSKLWSRDSSVSNVLSGAQSQGSTIYTAPKLYDNRMVEYYVEIGNQPGQYNPTIPSKPPTLAQATTKDGINWTPTKKSSSSSSSSAYSRTVANASTSGWSSSLHSRMGVA
jgi:hypothetical protein